MERGRILNKVIYSSWFLAGVPAIIFMLFIPHLSAKYNLVIEKKNISDGMSAFSDLNNDSISEFVQSGKGTPYYHILVSGEGSRIYDQWNFADEMSDNLADLYFGNYDNDGFGEIYVFTHRADSLFLNINEFFEPEGIRKEKLFISKIGFIKGEVTSTVYPAGFHDRNHDGMGEFYFSITTGFGLEPRRFFVYDIRNDRVFTSRFTGIICQDPVITDADGDGNPELFGLVSGSGNQKGTVPYTDWSTWLMIFNEDLEFDFEPVEFKGFPGVLEVFPYSNGTLRGYLLSNITNSADTTVEGSQIALYDIRGKKIRSRFYNEMGIEKLVKLFVTRDDDKKRIFILGDCIYELNEKLDIIKSFELPYKTYYRSYMADVDFDGNDEFLIYYLNESKLLVVNSHPEIIGEADFKFKDARWKFSEAREKGLPPKLYLSSGSEGCIIAIEKNRFFWLGYLAYPGIYLFLLVLVILTKQIATTQIRIKESLKQRLLILQLQGIKSQLDPHFTFNTLNSVASMIYLEDRQMAYDYMNKFTMLLRGMLNDAERIYRSLREEIEFVKTYLDLEKMRFGDKFRYEITTGEGVTLNEQVPKLVLQTFAENSLKHGLAHSDKDGLLRISVIRDKNYLVATIEDNGIGRDSASGKSSSTGKGLKLTREFYDILNQINKLPIKHLITDLFSDDGKPEGTRVEIWIPVD